MAKIAINSITNANVYLDGTNLLGRANEVKLPSPTVKMTDHQGLGMVGELEVPAGGFEKMEAEFTWESLYPEVARKAGNFRSAVQVQIRASMESYTGAGLTEEVGVVITLGGVFKQNDLGTVKKHEGVKPKSTIAVYYLKQVVDGATLLEIDVINNIYRVAGVDVLARYRALIGG